jgi:hypothetical protein
VLRCLRGARSPPFYLSSEQMDVCSLLRLLRSPLRHATQRSVQYRLVRIRNTTSILPRGPSCPAANCPHIHCRQQQSLHLSSASTASTASKCLTRKTTCSATRTRPLLLRQRLRQAARPPPAGAAARAVRLRARGVVAAARGGAWTRTRRRRRRQARTW